MANDWNALVVEVRKTTAFTLLFFLFLLPFATVLKPDFASAQTQPQSQNGSAFPFVNAEFANGTITQPNSPLEIWYDWVNVSGTQIINYVAYTNHGYPYPAPIFNIIGQHLQLADGSQVFVASDLDKFEVYSNPNGDGIPQGSFTSTGNGILYYMFINMSESVSVAPIQKVLVGNEPHYQWSFTYEHVYAYLLQPTSSGGINTVAALVFDHITLSYDFSVDSNVSNLKPTFDIGQVTSFNAFGSTDLSSLNGLSLALLYPTSTYASQTYSTSVNGHPYNSTTTQNSIIDAQDAQIAVGNVTAYEFLFSGNYTLSTQESNQTQQASIETYPAKAEVTSISSLPLQVYSPVVDGISFFSDELNLNALFGGSWPDISTDYSASSLVYRVCFPVWSGMQIVDDPLYVGYISGASSSTTVPELSTITILIPIFVVGPLIAVVVAKRSRCKHFT